MAKITIHHSFDIEKDPLQDNYIKVSDLREWVEAKKSVAPDIKLNDWQKILDIILAAIGTEGK